ncbi:YqcI/YcgG family protein [Paenibacillus sp. RRE4]|uniref:YqcI/YcgG family protein n=1 Tax=Paenibacillus sp. RRE4 TaxID=2962587 RepID=UPI002881A2B8|nr:YqcI/YcgG family protein [Paenibacillus sp. RRE4]MDT0123254.1 YqcI/YcgG family protein [Paenibacillus sp. RRE4]
MSELYSAEELKKHIEVIPSWQRESFIQFSNMIADEENTYPCVPGRMGFLSGHLRYGFISDPRLYTAPQELASILQQYGTVSRETGPYASLVVICETPSDLKEHTDVAQYQSLFWQVLNRTTAYDPLPWPEHISKDPNDASWEFCFNGEPYFCFCATPAHVQRKSRHFPFFMFAFQPRWVFEAINDDTSLGRKMKTLIRKRLTEYDAVPAHPSLMWYGQKDNLEWKQYFLPDNEQTLSKCPFMRMK